MTGSRRAKRGPGYGRRAGQDPTAYFYNGHFRPYGATWGVIVGVTVRQAEPVADLFPDPDTRSVGGHPVELKSKHLN